MSDAHNVEGELSLEVLVTEDNEVYVKFSGFNTAEDADNYADYLSKNLSLLLFESKVIH